MKPTKDDYIQIIDSLNRADRAYLTGFGHINTVSLSDEKLKVVKAALRLAANMPSEEEIHNLMAETISEDQPLFKTAARILERINSIL